MIPGLIASCLTTEYTLKASGPHKTALRHHSGPRKDAMTLFKEVVAENGTQRLELALEQLGAITKPYYICQLRHKDSKSPMDASAPLTFFHVQFPDGTLPTKAAHSLTNGLKMHFQKSAELMATLEVAIGIRNRMAELTDWTRIAAIALELEMGLLAPHLRRPKG